MRAPVEGGGSPGIEGELAGITAQIEASYADLLGIEAVSRAFIDTFGANQTGHPDSAPLGGGALGGSGAFYFDMPCSEPYHVAMLFARSEEDDVVVKEIDAVFAQGAAQAQGTGAWLCSLVTHLASPDPAQIESGAADQQQALLHAHGQFIDDFANVQVLVDRHFRGGTSDAFLTWYGHVDDVLEELIFFAGIAQVGAAGTANVIRVAQKSLLAAADRARQSFDESVQAWRNDPRSFPFPPGTAARAMKEFDGLVSKVEDYASLIPGPIGKGAEAVKTTQSVISAGMDLFGDADELPFTAAAQAAALLAGTERAFNTISKDAGQALDHLGESTHPQLAEVRSRSELVLPRLAHPGDPGWQFND